MFMLAGIVRVSRGLDELERDINKPTAVRSRPARIAPGAQTNVPRWPAKAPRLPGGARVWVVVDLGAADVAQSWSGQVADLPSALVELRSDPSGVSDDDVADLGHRVVAEARVGTRVAVCGPEADVMLLRAVLLAGGFLDEELLTYATSTYEIRVRCAHCSAITRHVARPGDVIPCVACGYDEVVHHHFSRRLASYLAFRDDGFRADTGREDASYVAADTGPGDVVLEVSGGNG